MTNNTNNIYNINKTDKTKALSIYIHIPFCKQKCLYCDFLSAPADAESREAYVKALCREICAEAGYYREHGVATVFFGGGTPSLLSGEQLMRIMDCLAQNYRLSPKTEITMEMNPGTVDERTLLDYRKAGVSRISLGLQSADNTELARLGRIHTWEDFLQTYALCRKQGAENINIDLMSALPGQSLASYLRTLEQVTALAPEHISAYSLIIEEGTPFYETYGAAAAALARGGKAAECGVALPDEETERQMYAQGKAFLESCGYQRYEISNYAKKGRECLHNCVYWQRGDYVGFGLGAASMSDNVRWSNVSSLTQYLTLPDDQKKTDRQVLSVQEQIEETMFLGLRMMQGVSKQAFMQTYGKRMEELYGDVIRKHVRQGLLEDGEWLRLTERGIDVSNYVLADFLLA